MRNTNQMTKKHFYLFFLLFSTLIQPVYSYPFSLVINEFVASNKTGITSIEGKAEDWIEIYNPTDQEINLAGWSLTDDQSKPTKFTFPADKYIPIRSNGYFLLYASGSTNAIVSGEWHVNFSLSKSGEYLALITPDGIIADEITPAYPEQYTDISYGIIGDYTGERPFKRAYYTIPTPRRINSGNISYNGRIPPPTVSQPRGFYTKPFQVELTTEQPNSIIRYTLDGSTPTEESHIYNYPLTISQTSILRTRAFHPDYLPSKVSSYSWIFIEDILSQDTMRQSIINNPSYRNKIIQGLKEIPTFSLSTDSSNLYGQTGIFDNYNQSGEQWERPISVEYIDPKSNTNFEINAGVRIRGAVGRASPKKSLRLIFGSKYEGNLNFPLFESEGVSTFSKIDLRTEQNNAWSSNVDSPWQNTFIREVFARDSQGDMGNLYTRSRYHHVYINGVYWGLYMTQERAEADFASSYLGGTSEEWDALKSSSQRVIEIKDGTEDAYKQFYQYALQGFSGMNENNYWKVKGMNPDGTLNEELPILLDEENLIDYILLTLYTADMDSPLSWINVVNNVSAVYHRSAPDGFKWLKHDAELTLGAHLGIEDSIDYFKNSSYWSRWEDFNPMDLHRRLINHPEYYYKFIDRATKHYLNNGALSFTNVINRWNSREKKLDNPIVVESARWGNQFGGGYTYETWKSALHLVTDAFLVGREYEMISLLKKYNWYPDINPPSIELQNNIAIIKADSPVYYTRNGSDPRLPGGGLNSAALELHMQTISKTSEEITLISPDSEWKCYPSNVPPDPQRNYSEVYWTDRLYNDYQWEIKKPALGFTSSHCYLRKSFVLDTIDDIKSATLSVIKGIGTISINGIITTPGKIPLNTLRQGRNLVTIDTDSNSGFDISITAQKNPTHWKTGSIILSDDTHLMARTLNNGVWSALSEFNPRENDNYDCSKLRITEMMYSANLSEEESAEGYTQDDFAWIEFRNCGEESINLKGCRFTSGIDYIFPDTPLRAGEYLVLVKNTEAFAKRYPNSNDIYIRGEYKSNLSRKGETITLCNNIGEVILTYTYSNSWYPSTDRQGYSLTVIDPASAMSLWSTPENWKQSLFIGGTPGTGINGEDDPPVIFLPEIISSPKNLSVTEGKPILLEIIASSSLPIKYQWYKDEIPIPDATNSYYSIECASLEDEGVYTVTLSNLKGTISSNEILLTIEPLPIFKNAILLHRYSFNENFVEDQLIAYDSINQANGKLYGSAYIQNGYLRLDGIGDTYSFTNGSFVALPPNLISPYHSYSIEMWARANEDKGNWMRLFDFGNCNTHSNGNIDTGHNYTMLAWKGHDHYLCSGVRIENEEDQLTAPLLPIGDGNFYHIVYVYDGNNKMGTLYTNGIEAASGLQRFSPSQFGSMTNMWIGKSLWGADPYFAGDFDEFRIYSGTLLADEIHKNYLAGTDIIPDSRKPFIESISEDIATYEGSTAIFSVKASGIQPLTYQWHKNNSPLFGETNATLTIDPAAISNSGYYYVKIANKYGEISSKHIQLTVKEIIKYKNATLKHRYNFSPAFLDNTLIIFDSISEAHGALYGNAKLSEITENSVSRNILSLDGEGDQKSYTEGSFVALPPDLISNFDSFTVEMWVRANKNKGSWMRLFDFGNCRESDGQIVEGLQYSMMTWASDNGDMRNGVRVNNIEQIVSAASLPIGDGVFHHIIYTYDSATQLGTIYIDGNKAGEDFQEFNPTQFGGCPNMWIGKSQFAADPYFCGDFDEFRIYQGTISEEEAAINYEQGTDIFYNPKQEFPPEVLLQNENGNFYLVFTGNLQCSTNLIHWENIPDAVSPYLLKNDFPILMYRTIK